MRSASERWSEEKNGVVSINRSIGLCATLHWERGRPRPLSVAAFTFSHTTISSRFALDAGGGARAPSKSLELCFALFDKRGVCFFKIRRLHAQGLRNCFSFESSFKTHVHFSIQHLFSLCQA